MPFDADKLDFQKGKPLLASDLQALRDAIARPDHDILGGVGIDSRKGPRGSVQLTAVSNLGSVGVATGDIPPRSGSTPGTGTVSVKRYDGTNLIDSHDVDVLNSSADTLPSGNSIDEGMYCWIGEDADGWVWVAPLECQTH